MKYIKSFNESLILKNEDGFDNIYLQVNDGFLNRDIILNNIDVLNKHNNNFDPLVIKDLFMDFIDKDFFEDINITKIYKSAKSTSTIDDIKKDVYSISYVIEVTFTLSNVYSVKNENLREEYLISEEKNRRILHEYYNHKSLNTKLGRISIFYKSYDYNYQGLTNYNYDNNKVGFDLWSKYIWLTPQGKLIGPSILLV
jgi:hypothetical protein